jgi:hypothetical protein
MARLKEFHRYQPSTTNSCQSNVVIPYPLSPHSHSHLDSDQPDIFCFARLLGCAKKLQAMLPLPWEPKTIQGSLLHSGCLEILQQGG